MVRVHPAWRLSTAFLAAATCDRRMAAASTPYPDSGIPVMHPSHAHHRFVLSDRLLGGPPLTPMAHEHEPASSDPQREAGWGADYGLPRDSRRDTRR